MKHILDKNFRYVPAGSTDIRKTFERVREELKKTEQQKRDNKTFRLKRIA